MSKQCFKCLETKPLSEFYRHPMMGDGHLGKCKTCTRADVAERETRLRNTDPEWTAKERERCRNKQMLSRLLGKAAPITQAHRIKWVEKNPHKVKAQRQARWALKNGIISKASRCNRCGVIGGRLEGHHEDYSKPLSVEWLCPGCHGETKRKDQ